MKKFFLLLSFFISTSSYAITVTGIVVDELNFPVPDVKVDIVGGGTTVTNNIGEFKLEVNSYPYDIFLTYVNKSVVAVRYDEISRSDVTLKIFTYPEYNSVNLKNFYVNYPEIPQGKEGIIQFVSKSPNSSKYAVAKSGSGKSFLSVRWPIGTKSIDGYIFYLERSSTEYTDFGVTNVTLNSEQYSNEFTIQRNSMKFDPGTASIKVNFEMGKDYERNVSIKAVFPELSQFSELTIPNSGDNYNYIVPASLPYGYKLNVTARIKPYDENTMYESGFIVKPNSVIDFKNGDTPQLIFPADKFNYNSSTMFSYGMDFEPGVYVVTLSCKDRIFHYVTTNTTVKDPLSLSNGILNGKEYTWNVTKLPGFGSVDHFVKEGDRYNLKNSSESRVFFADN